MKLKNNLLMSAVIVLVLFLCITASSANQQINETSDVSDELSLDVSNDNAQDVAGSTDDSFKQVNPVEKSNPETNEKLTLLNGTIYVSETGDDGNDGLSQETAIASISHAIEIVSARENKTATVYILNGDYTTSDIDIDDSLGVSLSIIGQEKGMVTLHGAGSYIFDVYGDNLVWNFKNIVFEDIDSTAKTSAALVLYSKNGNFTVTDCIFRNINSKLGAVAIGNDNGNTRIKNCLMEYIYGSSSSTSSLTVNGDGTYVLDNVTIKNSGLSSNIAETTSYLRSVIYVNTYEANVTLTNCNIVSNKAPMMSLIESRSKITFINSAIKDNVVNTSLNGANGGDMLVFASNDNSCIDFLNCVISNNTIVKEGKGLFYNNKAGSINAEYCDISNNNVADFIGLDTSLGTVTASNNWWGVNNRPDINIDKWVIMNVDLDDSALVDNNTINLTVDFNHVKTSSGVVEELTGGEIPKNSYSIGISALNGEITPTNMTVDKGEVKTQTFTVTEINNNITLTCDGCVLTLTIEGIPPYRGIIYVNKTGSDDNEGSIDAPVASLTKAIELANNGIGQIIINEGTYAGCEYRVTKDLNITGVGNVVLDAQSQGGLFKTGYPTNSNLFILSNLILRGADADYGQAINSYAGELILNNVNITNNPGFGSLIKQAGKLTINNCVIANHDGDTVIDYSGNGDLIINNTVFANNKVSDNAIVYSGASYNNRNAIVENTVFIGNSAKLGIFKVDRKTTIKNSKFINNVNYMGYGGAVSDCNSLTVFNSTFINNKAAKQGGAISIAYNRLASITHSVFINNTAGNGYKGDAIFNSGKLTVNYCIMLSNSSNGIIYTESEYEANAQYNWWGTNDNPKSLNGVGIYEDGYDEVECELDTSNWVYMNATADLNSVLEGDEINITVDFTNYIDSTSTLKPLNEKIASLNVTADATNGHLNRNMMATCDGIAKFIYTATSVGEDTITVKSGNATLQIPVNVTRKSVIYVSTTGSDANDGLSIENAVATINHAVELARSGDGKIVILYGEYIVTSILNITKDLEIIGQGDVLIKSNSIYSVSVWDDWYEEWDSETHYTLIENNANLKLNNIKFTLVPASIKDPLVLNNGNLSLNWCEFTNIKIASSKGVIQNIKTAKLDVNATTFKSASGTYGAINNNGELLVNNSKFIDNDRSSEGGVYSTAITSYNKAVILNSLFKNNKGTAGGAVYVMYSYTIKVNPVMEINNCTFEENRACGTSSSNGRGAAVLCSGSQITLTIVNSTFDKNYASKGGAVYAMGNVNIDQCVFTHNSADNGEALYADGGSTNIKNSIILQSTSIINVSSAATVTANDNWWGTNDKPINLSDNVVVERWVQMTAEFSPSNAEELDEVNITATFDNDKLPDGVIIVTFTSTSGNLNKDVVVYNSCAVTNYIIRPGDVALNAISSNANVTMYIKPPLVNVIYVSVTGSDANDGLTKTNAVASIKHAFDIVPEGGIIYLLKGTYELDELTLNKSVSIRGANCENTFIDLKNQTFFTLNASNIDFISCANITFINLNPTKALFNFKNGSLSQLNISNCKFLNIQTPVIDMELSNVEINLFRNYFELKQAIAVKTVGECAIYANNNIFNEVFAAQTNPINATGSVTGNMDYNYYATNLKPQSGSVPFDFWVIANININHADISIGDQLEITVDFNSYTNGITNTSQNGLIPDYLNATFTADGYLTLKTVKIQNGIASTVYSSNIERQDIITVNPTSLYVEVVTSSNAIYVQPGASDDNPGTRLKPVGTISKALELASFGEIILLAGTHRTGDLGVISDDLTITGEGKVIIDAEYNNRILYVGENACVVIKNVIMINGYTADESGALLGNSNELTLINCTLANSSAPQNNGGAIFNVAKLTIINTTISNCNSIRGGAIYTQTGGENVFINISNSKFENNIASGKQAWGGGAIYVQRTQGFYNIQLTIDNTEFINNKALTDSCGGAIDLEQLDATVKITNSRFISNHANAGDTTGGGAIYTTGPDNYQRYGTMTITGTLFENNTCGGNGGAIYARATTVSVSNSILINNSDINGIAVYGYRTDLTAPSITLNDNWWGSNSNPKHFIGGNNNYAPTINRWAILTITNDTALISGNTVKLTVSINNYTTGTANGTLSKPIVVKRSVVIKTNYGDIEGTLENGEFSYDYLIGDNLKFIMASLDNQTETLYAKLSAVNIEISEIEGMKFEKIPVTINVTSEIPVNVGYIELYVGNDKLATFEVKNSRAIGDVIISKGIGVYNLTARYVGGKPIFEDAEINTTLTVTGIMGLYNSTFFNYFDSAGVLRDEIEVSELVFNGEFSNLGINTITITRPISVIGNNAKLYDIGLRIVSDGSSLSNMTFITDSVDFTMNNGGVVSLTGEDIVVENIFINCTALNTKDSYAIFANSANNLKLTNSTIIFNSNTLGFIHHALHIIDSNNIEVSKNTINATLPSRDVNWHYTEPYFDSIDQDIVLAVGIQECSDGVLSENKINVRVIDAIGYNPTCDAIIVYGVSNFEISWNNITLTDSVNAGLASYANAIDLYSFDGVTIKYNNILVNTTSGINAKGTAYPIQATGPYDGLVINHNNLTSVSNGPALAIYSQNYNGVTDITVTFNNINVTGFASNDVYSLVSGMELQDSVAKVYNNTIYSQSKGTYSDLNSLYGISYAQDTYGLHNYDIRDNVIYTEGKYAIYLKSAKNTNIVGNTLYAHKLMGDSAVNIVDKDNCVIKSNRPYTAKLNISVVNNTVGEITIINITSDESVNATITVLINNNIYYNGEFIKNKLVSLDNLPAATYNLSIIFKSNDGEYIDCEYNLTFDINKIKSQITVSVDSPVKIGENTTITVNVVSGATGKVILNVSGQIYLINLNESNNITLSFDKSGNYTVVANYTGDEQFDFSISDVKTIIVEEKLDANIKIEIPQDIEINQTITINVTADTTSELIVSIDGVNLTLSQGKVTYYVSRAGMHTVNVFACENSLYNEGNVSQTFNANKHDSVIILPEFVNVKIADTIVINPQSESDGALTIKVNGVEINGTYTIPSNGTYVVEVWTSQTDNYNEGYNTTTFTALKDASSINITIIPARAGEKSVIYVNVTEGASGSVVINVSGSEHIIDVSDRKLELALNAGNYSVYAAYGGDNRFNASVSEVKTLIVEEKLEANIKIQVPQTIKVGETITVNVTADTTSELTVSIDGVNLTLSQGSVTYHVSRAGMHTVNVFVRENSLYKEGNVSQTFNASRLDSVIIIPEFSNVKIGDTIVINPQTNSDGALTIKVNDVIINGTYTVALSGNYKITVSSAQTDMYNQGFAQLTFEVAKFTSDINITVIPAKALDESKISIKITNGTTGEVIVKLNNTQIYKGLVNETSIVSLGNLTAGRYVVSVSYLGDEYFNATENVEEFNVFKSQSTLSASGVEITEGDVAILTVNVNSGATGKVLVVINGTNYYGDIINNIAVVKISNLTFGHYNVNITYLGDERYYSSFNNAVVIVKKQISDKDLNIDVNVPQSSTSPVFTVKLPGDASGNLTVIVDGKTNYTKTLVNGSATVNVGSLSVGNHNILVVYSGDDKYSNISKNTSVNIKNPVSPNVKKLATKIIAKKKTFKAKTKVKKYKITLKAGRNPVKKVKVTLKIKGKTYKAKTNAKGKATFKIKKLTKKGKHKAIIKFAGNKNYKSSKKTVKISVKK